ncbi:MAG TPA: iron-sulfur cluster repair di-iron protein [Pyrinomonadaceae bacterium]|nr:iron-sulfur cluster repair di-iron protein [Pyrinomonadaceae bacterium]
MTLDTSTTVRELAVSQPGATRIFEKMKIDYCCGGGRSLADACAVAGVKTEDVWQLLEEVSQSQSQGDETIDFQTASLTRVVKYILDKHHVFTKEEMARLEALAEKVCSVHGQNHPELLKVKSLFQSLCADLKPHMFKEERVLFPYIIRLEDAVNRKQMPMMPPFGTVQNPVRMMMFEHDTAGDLLRELRKVTSDYTTPQDACISYKTLYQALEAFEQDLHQHIHLENNVLFPRAIEMESTAYSA